MAVGSTVTIYHSCDPPGTKLLHHFKRGTCKSSLVDPKDQPTEKTKVPQGNGRMHTVLRCGKRYCETCLATQGEETELTLAVAKRHGLHGAYICPSPHATTAAERLRDGEERGRWMYDHLAGIRVVEKTQRTAIFHPQAAKLASVLKWLRNVPVSVDVEDSTPQENMFERDGSDLRQLHVPGLPGNEVLPVGAYFASFGAQAPSAPLPSSLNKFNSMKTYPTYVMGSNGAVYATAAAMDYRALSAYVTAARQTANGVADPALTLDRFSSMPHLNTAQMAAPFTMDPTSASAGPGRGVPRTRQIAEESIIVNSPEKRMLEHAGAVAQGRRKKARR